MTDTVPVPGRTRIAAKALTHLTAGVAASVLGVPVGKVQATVSDDAGALALEVSAPLRLAPLNRGRQPAAGETILERAERARAEIGTRVSELASRHVGRVDVEFTDAVIRQEGRVT